MGSSTWDTPAPDADNSWKTDGGDVGGGWGPDVAAECIFNGEFSDANISKHANGNLNGNAPADGGCRVCGSDGHFARDCPDKLPNPGECFNCGQHGHNKSECPNPRVEREFDGTCRTCNEVGHRAAECSQKGLTICKACFSEGHIVSECTANRLHSQFARMGVADLSMEDAWSALEAADKERDIDDVKMALFSYVRAFPQATLVELEATFREAGMNTHLIAKQQEVSDTHTIVNLQGQPEQKFVVSFQFSAKPKRAKFAEGWPESPEENKIRLEKAGFVMDGFVTKCRNCNEIGHLSKDCEQEKNESAKVAITCANCEGEGHRARDCTEERKSNKKGCRNCGSEEHIAKECPEPRSAEGVECKNCMEIGHFSRECPSREPEVCRNCKEEGHRAKDCDKGRVMSCRNCDQNGHISKECPEPRNMAKIRCRNCDEFGHTGRDCLKPTDWSRVECSNCHEKGHSYKRCTKPVAEADTGGDRGWEIGVIASSSSGGGGWGTAAAPAKSNSGGW